MIVRGWRPRFGDRVVLDGQEYRLAAIALRPRGQWLRPLDARDARHDRFLSLAEWEGLAWNTAAGYWEAAPPPAVTE
jgi:hypothetical protein